MMLFVSVDRNMSLIVFCLKSSGNVQRWALARARSSSKMSETSCFAPTFSSSAVCDGVSKTTLKGWKEMGLYIKDQHTVLGERTPAAYPIILSYCCCRMFVDTWQSTCPLLSVMARASAISPCIVLGMAGFLLAGPTQTSAVPLCSNSDAPS